MACTVFVSTEQETFNFIMFYGNANGTSAVKVKYRYPVTGYRGL
jgi:hypothetical protein